MSPSMALYLGQRGQDIDFGCDSKSWCHEALSGLPVAELQAGTSVDFTTMCAMRRGWEWETGPVMQYPGYVPIQL